MDVMPCVVHDYRTLNDNTVKDHTPVPQQDLILWRIAQAAVKRYIDLPDAYYQMNVHPKDIWKTAFKTPFGIFEWLVMPQELCNALATWQRFMIWILRDYIGKICYVYIDDIIIFSNSIEEHHRNVCLVLQVIHEAGLYLLPKKLNLYADKIKFLEHTVFSEGLEVTTATVDKITEWPVPHNMRDIKAFNGLVNYIVEFIPCLADHSIVLFQLTQKGVEFK